MNVRKVSEENKKPKKLVKFMSPVNHSKTKELMQKYKKTELADIQKRIDEYQRQLNRKKSELNEEKQRYLDLLGSN
jgi:hypothetical protein